MAIRYIKQAGIDHSKWDSCINRSLNGNFYALAWHLDFVAPHWDAIIEDDYVSVMPLVYQRRNLSYEVICPRLSGQLGVFSGMPVNNDKLQSFCRTIPKKFRKIKIYLNRQNSSTFKNPTKDVKSIFELDLISSFAKIQCKYSPGIFKNLDLAEKLKYWVMKHLSLSELDKYFASEELNHREFYNNTLRKVVSHLARLNRIEITGVYSSENMLCAIACFVKSNNNVVLLYAHSKKQIDSVNTSHLLLNSFLENYSARNITLSFDHMDENWNADLYTSFGAIKTYSNCINIDRGIRVLKWVY